jgi:multimeric flavodoxin WrbA
LADQVAAGAKSAGAEVGSFVLHDMDIRPCDGCDFCQGTDANCVIEDDMQLLYPKLRSADAIVVASPIYWFTMNAQTKLCIDRWYALDTPQGNLLAGKRIGIVRDVTTSNVTVVLDPHLTNLSLSLAVSLMCTG